MNYSTSLRKIFYTLLFTFALIGCKCHKSTINNTSEAISPISAIEITSSNTTPCHSATPLMLENKKWQLIRMEDKSVSLLAFSNEIPSVSFSVGTSYIQGYSGCNQFGGNCLMGNNTLDIGQLIATKRYCINVPEPEFLNLLKRCNQYCFEQELLLLKENDVTLLVFESSN